MGYDTTSASVHDSKRGAELVDDNVCGQRGQKRIAGEDQSIQYNVLLELRPLIEDLFYTN